LWPVLALCRYHLDFPVSAVVFDQSNAADALNKLRSPEAPKLRSLSGLEAARRYHLRVAGGCGSRAGVLGASRAQASKLRASQLRSWFRGTDGISWWTARCTAQDLRPDLGYPNRLYRPHGLGVFR